MPCWNEEAFLKEAIDSVIDQTIKPSEIVYVDDCSTDSSYHIAFSHEGRHVLENGIRCFNNEKNEGIGFTRKKGVEIANGDFVFFLSGDDVLVPHAIETMLAYAKIYPNSVIYSDFETMDEDGNKIEEVKSPEFKDYSQFTQAVLNSARDNKMFVCYNIFAPARLLKENNFDGGIRFGEDLEHLLRCILIKKINFVHVPWALFRYRVHARMTTQQRWDEIAENNRKSFDKINSLAGKTILPVGPP